MRPLIAITASYGNTENRYYLNRPYVQAIHQAGGLGMIVPTDEPKFATLYLERAQGLLLSGGGDLDPNLYGQEPHSALGPVDSYRDSWELTLARLALEKGLPILAICRGLQVLNVAVGGTLYQDIPSLLPGSLEHVSQLPRNAMAHEVQLESRSLLARIFAGERIGVNSFHHQAVELLAPLFRAVAWANDGIIEAFELPKYPFLIAVQWHPEELVENQGPMLPLFEAFVLAARKYMHIKHNINISRWQKRK